MIKFIMESGTEIKIGSRVWFKATINGRDSWATSHCITKGDLLHLKDGGVDRVKERVFTYIYDDNDLIPEEYLTQK